MYVLQSHMHASMCTYTHAFTDGVSDNDSFLSHSQDAKFKVLTIIII